MGQGGAFVLEQSLLEAVEAVAVVEGGAAGQGQEVEEAFFGGGLFSDHHGYEAVKAIQAA